MNNPKDLLLGQLLQAGEAGPVTPEVLKLDSYRLTSQTKIQEEMFLFRHFGKPCFPRKELTTITGAAKSGKTFFTSMVMACCAKREVMTLERIRDEPLRVMWYDTEQSLNTTKEILVNRVGKMIEMTQNSISPADNKEHTEITDRLRQNEGHTDSTGHTDISGQTDGNDIGERAERFPDELFYVFNMRAAMVKERRELLGVAVATYRPDIVVLDGIADLLTDINDGPKAQELMEELLNLADKYECNITTVIHLNRTGEKSNLRGWLGSALMQKSFEVFNCSFICQSNRFCVELNTSRKYRNDQNLYYQVGEDGIPVIAQYSDTQERDALGRFTSSSADKAETLNRDYIIRHDGAERSWEWDLRRLFSDAMGAMPSMNSDQMMEAVMRLSHIRQKQYYYQVLEEAVKQGIVQKTFDRYKRVAIIMAPPR